MTDIDTRRRRNGALATILAPVVMAVGLVSHPFIGLGPPDPAVIGGVIREDIALWGAAHLLVAVGSALLIVAFLVLRDYLRDAGEERRSSRALPYIAVGSTLFAMLPAMEFAPMLAAETGGAVAETQTALFFWFVPVLVVGAVVFMVGAVGFARAIAASAVLGRPLGLVVTGSLLAMAASRFAPIGLVQLYVQAAAGLLALVPMGYVIWRHPTPRVAPGPSAPRAAHGAPSRA